MKNCDYHIETIVNNDLGITKHTLYYSKSEIWTLGTRGKKILSCIDNGNGFIYKFNQKFNFKKLDYDQAEYMFIILKYIRKRDKQKKLKIIQY